MSSSQTDAYRCGFIAIVGRPNVGKSTLLNHLIGQKVSITSRKAQTTRHRITGIRTEDRVQYVFVDTPGFQTYHKSALNDVLNRSVTEALTQVDSILFVVEAMRWTPADAELLPLLPSAFPVFLVVNKCEKAKDKAALAAFIADVQSRFGFVGAQAVSAKQGHGLTSLLALMQPLLPASPPLYPEDTVTDRSERFLAAEIVREKVFRYLGEELPYAMHVSVDQFELEGALRRVHITILVDKPGQKGIVVGERGLKLKKIATEARQDMEKLFQSKVFLQVWVKVKSGWADGARFLKEFGVD